MKNFTAIALAALTIGSSASAAPLFFDDFETNSAGANLTPSGWSVSNGTVDIVGPVPNYFPNICSSTGGNCIDLDGSSGNAGTMTSLASFVLQTGVSYTLSFDYSWNYFNQQIANTMTFGVGGFSDTLTTNGTRSTNATPYTPLTFSFVGNGSTGSIFFDHQGGDNGGIVIDNVRFEGGNSVPVNPVPLPAGLPLLAAGLAGLAVLRRRK